MCIAQTMTPTSFGSTARWLVSLAVDSNLNVMASLQACFLQSEACENGDPNRGSLENVTLGLVRRDPADGGVRGETNE
jgi:hypothetical protein